MKEYVVQNPPSLPLTTREMDDVYALPYMRTYHPSYDKLGGVPAIEEEIKFSGQQVTVDAMADAVFVR